MIGPLLGFSYLVQGRTLTVAQAIPAEPADCITEDASTAQNIGAAVHLRSRSRRN